jgi:uncharacterized protein (DUF1800 family)
MKLRSVTCILAASGLVSILAACGGGSGTSAPPTTNPPPPSISQSDASRLLEQATFGPTATEVENVMASGADAYIGAQIAVPASGYTGFSYVPHTADATCKYDPTAPTGAASLCSRDNYSLFQVQRQFFENALTGKDQLRQRVAFALSQMMVVSGNEIYEAYGMAAFQNTLLADAFGNFRDLMNDVTLSPVMGHYLDMANNDKPNASQGTEPNEDYAREFMQLFTIGLYQLNADGSMQLDAQGNPIPTYDQTAVQGYARLFTGWTYPPLSGASSKWVNAINYQGAMVAFADHHDPEQKTLLNGTLVAAGGSPEADLKSGLDLLFGHPNVGPFVGKQLIQHLVTGSPSPAYVARVAAVFNDNGQGVRGDLGAVVKAILEDAEARGDVKTDATYGHLREPALFITSVVRSLGGQSDGVYLKNQANAMGQNIFTPPSVFSFYPPDYTAPNSTLIAPEFAIQNATTELARANFIYQMIYNGGAAADPTVTGSTGSSISLDALAAQAASDSSLLDALNTQLMHGALDQSTRGAISTALDGMDSTDATARAQMAVYLLTVSPQFQAQR